MREPMNRTAVILLSTFNGERFLRPLLDSLVGQDWPATRILARDDGSSDSTMDVLAGFESEALSIMPSGQSCGAALSFMSLLAAAPAADATFFADQDDVWYPDKLRRAMTALVDLPPNIPALYCTGLAIVDENLAPVSRSPVFARPPAFANALVENIATGCTIALNGAAVRLLRSVPLPSEAIMHDWWAYLVVSAFGTVIYDARPSLAYRLHGQNAVGMPKGRLAYRLGKIGRELRSRTLRRIVDQALAFDRAFADRLAADQRAMIARLAGLRTPAGRLAFLGERQLHRQFATDDVALRLLALLGRAA